MTGDMNHHVSDLCEQMAHEMKARLELLVESMNSFRSEYSMTLHVKDFYGCLHSHPLMGEFTESYLYHESSFCRYVKSNAGVNEQCIITSNDLLLRTLNQWQAEFCGGDQPKLQTRGFYGICWCGIREYVYPVCHNGVVIGALLAGSFPAEDARRDHCFDRLCRKFGLDNAVLQNTYRDSVDPIPDHMDRIERHVSLFAACLSMLAEYYVDYSMIAGFHESVGKHTQRHKIVSLAADYITKNLSRKISVADMAVYCMCSKSTLNHIFSGTMGRTIPEYVSIQRVNRSKYLLLNTDLSIDQISNQCGFTSSAYYSVVFKKVTDMTPTEYRRWMMGKNSEDITGIL